MAPSRTVHDSGFWLAFQPSRVLPSNMRIQPSLSAADRPAANRIPMQRTKVFMAYSWTAIVSRGSRNQLKTPVGAQIVFPAAPQDRVAEEPADPHRETENILHRHEEKQARRKRVAQDEACCSPTRDGAEHNRSDGERPPSRLRDPQQQRQRQRDREQLADVARRARAAGTP